MKFDTVGIVCEYNPFHFGHKYHIEKTRELTGCSNIICIMSGSLVQRGECAIYDKWQRARYASCAGADLVIELPAFYVLQSSDVFAQGAIELLNNMKVADAVSFGCECGDMDIINDIASVMTKGDGEYNKYIKEYMKSGYGYPKASELSLLKCMPEYCDVISKPNNTLAVSYVKAINNLNSNLIPLCIKRNNDYHGNASNDEYISATEIRKRIADNIDFKKYAPDYSVENTYSIYNAESFILGYLRTLTPELISSVKGGEEGLANLVINSAKKACSLDELFTLCTNKRYTLHRIKRYILCALLGINYDESPDYLRVLAIGKNGKKLLKEIKEKSNLTIVTKTASYSSPNKMFATDIKATDFASLCSDDVSQRVCGRDFTTSPYVLKGGL